MVNCDTKSFVTRTVEMRESNGTNGVNETVIKSEITCARKSMEVRGSGKGSITYVANKNQVY